MAARAETRSISKGILIALACSALAYLVLVEFARYTAVVFCGVLLAVALAGLARLINRGGHLPHGLALSAVVVILLGMGVGLSVWMGPQLVDQFDRLREEVPRGFDKAKQWLGSTPVGKVIEQQVPSIDKMTGEPRDLLSKVRSAISTGLATLTDALIVIILGLFLAASPGRYARGVIHLLPKNRRERGSEVLGMMGHSLRRWLVARGILMLLVGVLMGIGLTIIGIPLALPLALLAGTLSFIPFLGPTLAFIPAVGMGLLVSPSHALYVALLYLGIQLLESYLVEPLVESRAVSVPPALIIVAQVISAVWLGPVGVLIATPLLVVVVVLVQAVYQQDVLGDDVSVIGTE